MKNFINGLMIVLVMLSFSNCTTAQVEVTEPEPLPALLIGVTTDYPPIIFKQSGEIVGVEADLARVLAKELGRSVEFIELRWDQQVPSLMAGETDMIMSGMSITQARRMRIEFADHYLKSGLVAMMHIENAITFDSIEKIKQSHINIGARKGTTSETFVRENFPNALRVATLSKASDAPAALINRSIDIFVHDAPSIMWLVSENEAELTALWEPLNDEALAWGIRKDDRELLMNVNSILTQWKQDGTLKHVLLRWLPAEYLEQFK